MMERKLYRISEFAKKSSVSVRTLQFYDKQGLLSPAATLSTKRASLHDRPFLIRIIKATT